MASGRRCSTRRPEASHRQLQHLATPAPQCPASQQEEPPQHCSRLGQQSLPRERFVLAAPPGTSLEAQQGGRTAQQPGTTCLDSRPQHVVTPRLRGTAQHAPPGQHSPVGQQALAEGASGSLSTPAAAPAAPAPSKARTQNEPRKTLTDMKGL